MSAGVPPRSILFVPGDRPDRFGKALGAGADAVCVDLEDAVAGANKGVARANVASFLAAELAGDVSAGRGRSRNPETEDSIQPILIIRMNDPRSADGERDLETIADLVERASRPVALMIPKVRTAGDVVRVEEVAGNVALLPIVETVAALEDAPKVAAASRRVVGVVFGGFDLAVELGAEPHWEPLLYARSRVVHAAALAGIVAIDMPRREIRDLRPVREEAAWARRLGFAGKIAIHPAQIGPIHKAFAPSAEEVARARRIVEADGRAGGSAVSLGGKMVDRPVVAAAHRALARARRRRPDAP